MVDTASIIQPLHSPDITPIARQAAQCPSLRLRDWQVSQLVGGVGNPVSVGLYRFAGIGQDGAELVPWSVVLKILQSPGNSGWVNMGEGEIQTHWNYWKREILVYQSGLLETLPEGLVAPRCYGTADQPGEIAWLWLEDIRDAYVGTWPLERYALTARHLGRLNGLYISEHSLPAFPWLSRQRNSQWIDFMPHWQPITWEHPRVLRRYPRLQANTFRRMLLEHERFLAKLDLLPKTVSHGDTYPTNFMSRNPSDSQEQTVALDWALMGIEPLGDDLGQLVFGAQLNLKEVKREEVTETLFEAYLAGLQDSGCRVDPVWVRFGFAASAALRVGLFQVLLLDEELKQGELFIEELVEDDNLPECFEVTMANEAYGLLEAI